MDANMKKRNELLAKTVIKGLESRNMSGYYAQDKEAALKQALELSPNGSTIAMGGFMSAHEIGLVKALQDGDYNYIDRAKLEPREGLMAAYDADFFLSSANAVTDDGVLVNIDVLVADSPSEAALVLRGDKVIDLVVEIGDLRPRLIFFCLKPDIEGPGFSGSRCSLPQTWTCMRPMLRSIWEYSSKMDGDR